MSSIRSAVAHEGSSTTIGSVPSPTPGASSVRRSTAFASSSWPVAVHVSPQHTSPPGSATSNPAAARTRTAATPTSGARWFVNVSGHRSTWPRDGAAGTGSSNVSTNERRASRGIARSPARPPIAAASRRVGGSRVTPFTSRGPHGIRRVRRSQSGSRPSR